MAISHPSTTTSGATVPGVARLSHLARQNAWGLTFVLPSVVFFVVFAIFPVFFGFYLSLTKYNLISPPSFVGLDNYRALFSDRLFLKAAGNTILFVLGTTVPVWALSLALAVLFDRSFKGNHILRAIAFSPILPPLVVVAVVWKLLLHPNGLLTSIVAPFFGVAEIRWLNDVAIAPLSMIFVHDWTIIPFFMMIWLAGLAGVPTDLKEAARVDGAGAIATFYFVTLPLLRSTAVLVASLATITAFQAFILQYVLAPDKGGPADSTLTLALLAWRYGFQYFRMGDAAAISFVIFGTIMAITALQLWIGRQK